MKHKLLLGFMWLIIFNQPTFSQIGRKYEPIIIKGEVLSAFFGKEINKLYLFSYQAANQSWTMIPFQFDEVNTQVDDSIKYFAPDDGLLDENDELVFMAADLGDKAENDCWQESTDTLRLALSLLDSLDNRWRYVYLYHSEFIGTSVPDCYQLQYHADNDRISSAFYEVGFNETGLLGEVALSPEIGASGLNIFDRTKIRFYLSFLWIPLSVNEDSLSFVSAHAKVGPVRIIRNMTARFQYRIGVFPVEETFTQTSFFYPWHGMFELMEIPIGDLTQYGVQIDEFRTSWDFNSAATGMKFYSEYNQSPVSIDGASDVASRTILPDDLNWSMGTGTAGTLLNIFYTPPLGDSIRLYFHQSTTGSAGDNSLFAHDTGDGKSYGDNGFSLIGNIENYITDETRFNFRYYNFFLPPFFDPDSASRLTQQIKFPLTVFATTEKKTSPAKVVHSGTFSPPNDFYLLQNFPNPFNAQTSISFVLTKQEMVSLEIFNATGSLIKSLLNTQLAPGTYRVRWNGENEHGEAAASGIYFYRLTTESNAKTRKLILVQ